MRQLVFVRDSCCHSPALLSPPSLTVSAFEESFCGSKMFIKSLMGISCGHASELPLVCIVSVNTQWVPTACDGRENTIRWLFLQTHSFVFCAAAVLVVLAACIPS